MNTPYSEAEFRALVLSVQPESLSDNLHAGDTNSRKRKHPALNEDSRKRHHSICPKPLTPSKLEWVSGDGTRCSASAKYLNSQYSIHVIDCEASFEHHFPNMAETIRRDRVFTFDTESNTSAQLGVKTTMHVDMIQIGTMDGVAYLFRPNLLPLLDVHALAPLFADRSIAKLGSGINGDTRLLKKDWDIDLCSQFDVQHIAKKVLRKPELEVQANRFGLKNLCMTMLGFPMSKAPWTMFSKVNQKELDPMLKKYAADDVISLVDLLEALFHYSRRSDPSKATNPDYLTFLSNVS